MSLIIETTDDFIRALRENEEFKAAARRELLTQDLLALPKEFSEFKTSTEERFDAIDKRFDAVDERFDGIDRRLDGMDQRFDGMDQRFDRVEEDIRNLTTSVNDLRGSALELKMSTRLRQRLAATLELTHPRTLWLAEHYVQPPGRAEEFARRMEHAADMGEITEEEIGRLIDTDMVVRAINTAGERVHVAVEASGVIGNRDIGRARQSAGILKKMYRQDSVAAVYGYSIEAEQFEHARATDDLVEVHVFLETESL